ncbi:hypothetical protein ACQZ6F_27450 [Rhizobium sp. A22-96]
MSARANGFSDAQARMFEGEILAAPVIQTGPHLHLLIEPDAFFTHLFSLIGMRRHQRCCYLSYACATVKFLEKSRKGPGWIRVGGQAINLFGLSRSRMVPFSILAANDRYRFVLQNVDRPGEETEQLARLREALPSGDFSSAAAAIKVANRSLWSRYVGTDASFLQLDEGDIAGLVIRHLLDEKSWLRVRLIEDRDFARNILGAIDFLAETPWRGWLRNSTHFFWSNRGGHLSPLLLDGAYLVETEDPDCKIEFAASSLIDALTEGRIVPNLVTVFLVLAILPGVRVLGGSHHAVYYPLMRYVLSQALRHCGQDRSLLRAISQDEKPSAWGHRLITSDAEPFSILGNLGANGVDSLIETYGRMSINDASGSLSGFTNDPSWADLAARFASGRASVASPEWAFA